MFIFYCKVMITYIRNANIFEIDGVVNYAQWLDFRGHRSSYERKATKEFRERFVIRSFHYYLISLMTKLKLGDTFEFKHDDGYGYVLIVFDRFYIDVHAVRKSVLDMFEKAKNRNISKIATNVFRNYEQNRGKAILNVIKEAAEKYPDIELIIVG